MDVVLVTVFSGRSFVYADLVSFICGLRKVPVVLALHGGRLPTFAQRHPRWVDRVVSRADLLVAPSAFLARTFESSGHPVHRIPNAIVIDDHPYRHRVAARPRLLWMRTFHHDYDPELAPAVLAIVRQTHPQTSLTMAGADHGLLSATQARARALGLEDAITFAGFLDTDGKRRAFEDHDLFLNTNRVDNMPVSILEVAAAGLVPISTDAGGIPDLLTDGQDSRVVPVGNAEEMASAVCELLDDPKLYATLGLGARALAERSSWPTVNRVWLDDLSTLAEHSPRRRKYLREHATRMDGVTDRQKMESIFESYDSAEAGRWSANNSGNRAMRRETTNYVRHLLGRSGCWPIEDLDVLDVGCGSGSMLEHLRVEGGGTGRLIGVDLRLHRLQECRRSYPDLTFMASSGGSIALGDNTIDVALASLLFSSVNEPELRARIASEIARVLRPGGILVWYDMRWPNPGNRAVHPMSRRMVSNLFPGWEADLRSTTLLPPLARRLGPRTGAWYPRLARLPPLRSHLIGVVHAPDSAHGDHGRAH